MDRLVTEQLFRLSYNDSGKPVYYFTREASKRTYGWKPNQPWGTDPLWLADITTDPTTHETTWTLHYYHNDHLGTPQRLTDKDGNATWQANYDTFGKAIVDPSSTVNNPLRFAGQFYDSETGTHYNYFRDYDPLRGGYIQSDPIGLKAGVNFYTYAEQNPVLAYDPYGLLSSCCQQAKQMILQNPKNKGAHGTVVCCYGKKESCVWSEQGATMAPDTIIRKCKIAHEDKHQEQGACQCECDQVCLLGVPTKDKNKSECEAYRVQIDCMRKHLRDCGGNVACRNVLRVEIAKTTETANNKYVCGISK